MTASRDQGSSLLRIGKISYLNFYPIFYSLEQSARCQDVKFVPGVPSTLNQMLRLGIIDVSPSSSIEFLRAPRFYRLIEGHSLSAFGTVGSILLFSKLPIAQLHRQVILTSDQSETSIALLDILLKKYFRLACLFLASSLPLQKGLESYPAYLLIGDDALKAVNCSHDLYVYDLGEIWKTFTDLPFVYALWIVNQKPEKTGLTERFGQDLDKAKDFAINNLETIALSLKNSSFLSQEALIAYWRRMSYDLTHLHQQGLERFRLLAHETGWL
jgi:chorismate dehydratase